MAWYAMRATYGRNVVARRALEAAGLHDTFIPMRRTGHRRTPQGAVATMVPAVTDLIFVLATRREIQQAKQGIPCLHYIMARDDGSAEPLTVPERQMRPFIEANTKDDNLVWLTPADMRPGERFRILDGPFRGLEATVQRLPGRRASSVIVQIEGLIAAAISLPIESLEKIRG